MKKLLILFIACAALLRSCFGLPSETEPPAETTVSVSQTEYSPPGEKVDVPLYDTVPRYAYLTLDDKQKALYEKIRDGALGFEPYTDVGDDADAEYVYQAVFFDTPELFYITETPKIKYGKLYYEYVFTAKQLEETLEALDAAYEEFLSVSITDDMGEFEKFFNVYTYIINITKYAHEEYDLFENNEFTYEVYRAMSAAGPLCDRSSICTGYARATQYLCERLGIQCFMVNGYGNNGLHYFNLVRLDGDYYFSDTTWGDPVGQDRSVDYLTYYYFCTTTEETLHTREIRSVIPMPECTATKYNYYDYFGRYCATVDEAHACICRLKEENTSDISIKVPYENDEIYESLLAGSLYGAMEERGLGFDLYRIAYNRQTQVIIIRF